MVDWVPAHFRLRFRAERGSAATRKRGGDDAAGLGAGERAFAQRFLRQVRDGSVGIAPGCRRHADRAPEGPAEGRLGFIADTPGKLRQAGIAFTQ